MRLSKGVARHIMAVLTVVGLCGDGLPVAAQHSQPWVIALSAQSAVIASYEAGSDEDPADTAVQTHVWPEARIVAGEGELRSRFVSPPTAWTGCVSSGWQGPGQVCAEGRPSSSAWVIRGDLSVLLCRLNC
jgi:hypothetical protein